MAKQATISADEAERRYEHLIHLTRIAKIEADSIRDIAVNLTDTARSVAKLAIGICRSSYWGEEDPGRDPPFTIQTHLGLHELQKLSGSKMERDAGGSEQDLAKDSRDPSDGMDQQYPGNDEGHDSSGLVEDADKIQERFDRNSDQDQVGTIPSDLNNHIETGVGSADSNRDLVSSKNSNLFVGFTAM